MATWQVDCEGTELTATAESGKQNLCGGVSRGCDLCACVLWVCVRVSCGGVCVCPVGVCPVGVTCVRVSLGGEQCGWGPRG